MSSMKSSVIERWQQVGGNDDPAAAHLGYTTLFYQAILHLFGKLVLACQKTSPPPLPRTLLDKYAAELHRLYAWGDSFATADGELERNLEKDDKALVRSSVLSSLQQLGQSLRGDLLPLVGPHLSSGTTLLTEALDRVDRLEKAINHVEGRDEETGGLDKESISEEQMPELNGEEILEDIVTYVDCLMDLYDVLSSPTLDWSQNEVPAPPEPEIFAVSPDAITFCRRIRDRYPELPKFLVERLAQFNAARHNHLKLLELGTSRTVVNMEPIPNYATADQTTISEELASDSHLSTIRPTTVTTLTTALTSVFTTSSSPYNDEDAASVTASVTVSTLASYRTTETTRSKGIATVPPLPAEAQAGGAFRCNICHKQVVGLTSQREWKKHVFNDLRPYCCTVQDCNSSGSWAQNTYGSTKAWMRHEMEHFKNGWQSRKCPFCEPQSPPFGQRSFFEHASKHMQGISLAVLPRTYYDDSESDDDADSTILTDNEPLGGASDPPSNIKFSQLNPPETLHYQGNAEVEEPGSGSSSQIMDLYDHSDAKMSSNKYNDVELPPSGQIGAVNKPTRSFDSKPSAPLSILEPPILEPGYSMPLYSSDTGIGQSIETTPRFGSGHRQQDILNQKFSPPAVSDLSYSQPDSSNEPEQSSGPIFLLVPTNPAARKATENVLNSYYQWREDDGNVLGLWIDLSNPSHSTITLGRTDTNIHLPDTWSNTKGSSPHISSLHASFEVIPETGAVLLWDHSKDANVEPFAPNHLSGHSWTVKFRSSARRSVIVARGINSHVAFGKDKWYQFEIQWQSEAMYGFSKGEPYQMGPRQARTKRYVQLDKLGGGVYGTVYSALDATTGLLIAVKRFHNLIGKVLTFATREVANLRIRELRQHPHILRILDSAGGGEKDNWGEIFMPLQKGNLKDLVGMMGDESQKWTLSEVVLRQMLSALECLEAHHIIHRDVKPDNILWEYDENGNYIFCLGDFGLSNDPKVATTTAGTAPFMAPEVFNRQKHTTKIDIWSLYATIVWMRSRDFRAMCSSITAQELHHQLTKISKLPDYSNIRGMGAWNPRQRPSPSQQLYILDHGDYNFVETDGYAPVEQANPVEDDSDLANQFVQNISLGGSSGPSLTYGSGSSEHPASPEVPYYEPYAPQIYFPQRGKGGMQQHRAEKGDGRFHQPLPHSTEISPEDQAKAWVAEYNTNIYGTLENQDTAVPATMATAIPMGTASNQATLVDQGAGDLESEGQGYFGEGDYEYEYYLEERRQKGKKRNYR